MQQEFEIPVTRFSFGYSAVVYLVVTDGPIDARRLYHYLRLWREYIFMDPVIRPASTGRRGGVWTSLSLSQAYPQVYQDLLGEAQRLEETMKSCIYSGSVPVLVDSKSRTRIDPKTLMAATVLDSFLAAVSPNMQITPLIGDAFHKWGKARSDEARERRTATKGGETRSL